MLKASLHSHQLRFRFAAGTSRGVLHEKKTSYLKLWHSAEPEIFGIGECGPLAGLSIDDVPHLEAVLTSFCQHVPDLETTYRQYEQFPALVFAYETALQDLKWGGQRRVFLNDFTSEQAPIAINGLIWMGSEQFMLQQIEQKLENGYTCLKLKIGAIDFEAEKKLLSLVRKRFSANEITLRVDANGAFDPANALEKLKQLSEFDLHSIEQPIKQGQWDAMAALCLLSPIPIALDEELIGVHDQHQRELLMQHISPQYLILKPTLLGGFKSCDHWISLANKYHKAWWITSALESNIGLNAICQYTFEKIKGIAPPIPQGLGTGGLYENNIPSPLEVQDGRIRYLTSGTWDIHLAGLR